MFLQFTPVAILPGTGKGSSGEQEAHAASHAALMPNFSYVSSPN